MKMFGMMRSPLHETRDVVEVRDKFRSSLDP
jgi:hypothetical protein